MNSIQTTKFHYQTLIPFHFIDQAGILFFAHVFTLANEALEHFVIEKLNLSWKEWFNNDDWIAPIKESKATFLKPIFGGLECDIALTIESISTSSIAFRYDFFQSNSHCCQVNIVHVFCSNDKGMPLQKMAIPLEIKCRLENYSNQ